MWDLIVSVPDHCLSFYLAKQMALKGKNLAKNLSEKTVEPPA